MKEDAATYLLSSREARGVVWNLPARRINKFSQSPIAISSRSSKWNRLRVPLRVYFCWKTAASFYPSSCEVDLSTRASNMHLFIVVRVVSRTAIVSDSTRSDAFAERATIFTSDVGQRIFREGLKLIPNQSCVQYPAPQLQRAMIPEYRPSQ